MWIYGRRVFTHNEPLFLSLLSNVNNGKRILEKRDGEQRGAKSDALPSRLIVSHRLAYIYYYIIIIFHNRKEKLKERAGPARSHVKPRLCRERESSSTILKI